MLSCKVASRSTGTFVCSQGLPVQGCNCISMQGMQLRVRHLFLMCWHGTWQAAAGTSAALALYFSTMSRFLLMPYCLRKALSLPLPPACIFFSWSWDQASMVTDL